MLQLSDEKSSAFVVMFTMNTNNVKEKKERVVYIACAVFLIFCYIVVKILSISSSGSSSRRFFMSGVSFDVEKRSDILDRNGNIIANNIPTISAYLKPNEMDISKNEFLEHISQIFPERCSVIKKDFEKGKNFIWIKRHMTPNQKLQLMNLGLAGIYVQNTLKRVYPNRNLMSHVIGVVDIDGNGISGIEKKFNDQILSSEEPLMTTIDIKLQHAMRDELQKGIDEFQAQGGCGILMDRTNGEILSLVSLPDFDPNQPSNGDHVFNIATYGLYEPGSIAKIFNVAIGLESKKISLNSEFDISKPLRIGRFTISDFKQKSGKFSVADIFKYSSNIGSAQIAMEFGEDIQKEYFQKFGLLDKLDFDLEEVSSPIIPDHWKKAALMTLSFGHGIAITPLHMITAIAGISNNGKMYAPKLIKDSNYKFNQIVSVKTSKMIRDIMRTVVRESSGRKANIEGYNVDGKTGTAEKVVNGYYNKKSNVCFFVGNFDKYTILIMLDSPHGNESTYGFATANWNATKVAGKVIKRVGAVLGIPPETVN